MTQWPGQPHKEQTTFGGLSRSELMSRVRSYGNVTTEVKMAKLLRKAGLKGWRRHQSLPGKPDFFWPRQMVVLFVDGCFWHGHGCKRNLTPKTNSEKWREKILNNRRRDSRIRRKLREQDWKVISIWECQLEKKPDKCLCRIKAMLDKS